MVFNQADFPREYKRIIDASGISLHDLAKKVNIPYKRLDNIIYNRYGMDNTEYRAIRNFCMVASTQKKIRSPLFDKVPPKIAYPR